jgi:serine phosphatase RsbU (regulator of sigma subunit)
MATNDTAQISKNVLGASAERAPSTSQKVRPTFNNSNPAQKDVLDEAREVLQEPSRNTKRKILISINLIIGFLVLIHVVIQLATTGHLPDPERDNIILPALIVINIGSAIYNLIILTKQLEGSRGWNAATAWVTVLILQIVCLSIVHRNPNTATSLLMDQSLSIITIFLTGMVLNRRAALGWFIITLLSLIIAVKARGTDFEYHLMTRSEVAKLNVLRDQEPALFAQRALVVAQEKLSPLSVLLGAIVSGLFSFVAILVTYFEAGMIGQVLGVIPTAIDKIQIASKQKQQLEQENVRMGMELDVAQRIQAFILPREEELSKCAGIEVVARMEPATEVGGDLYDVLPQPDGSTFFAIGDVTDHGLASGVVMLMSQTAIRTCVEDAKIDLVEALAYVNSVLFKNVQTRMGDSRNLTLSLLHHRDGHVRLAGQHESVILLRKDSTQAEQVDTSDLGICVGMIDDISPMLAETSFDLKAGDMMLLYTDGATEAEDPRTEQFTVERLMDSLVQARGLPSHEIMDRLFSDIKKWISSAPMFDDITLVLVRKSG